MMRFQDRPPGDRRFEIGAAPLYPTTQGSELTIRDPETSLDWLDVSVLKWTVYGPKPAEKGLFLTSADLS